MYRYKSLFREDNPLSREYKDLTLNLFKLQWDLWKSRFPDEPGIQDPRYMDAEIERGAPEWVSFIVKSFEENLYVKAGSFAQVKVPFVSIKRACYYNALDFVLKYKDTIPNLDLCIGFLIEQEQFDKMKKALDENKMWASPIQYCTKHVFCKIGNKIFDPTLKSAFRGNYYTYRIIPENDYKHFYHKENDPDFNAKDVEKYFDNILNEERSYFDVMKEFLKFVKRG